MEVKMEVNSLRSWELKWTIPNMPAASNTIVQPAVLAIPPAPEHLLERKNFQHEVLLRLRLSTYWSARTPYLTPSYNSRNLNKII